MALIKTPAMAIRASDTPAISDVGSLKLWFKCDETSGTTLTDSIYADRVYTPDAAPVFSGGGIVLQDTTNVNIPYVSHYLPTIPDTSDFLMVVSFASSYTGSPTANSSRLLLGAGSGQISYSIRTTSGYLCQISDGVGSANITNTGTLADGIEAIGLLAGDQSGNASAINATQAAVPAAVTADMSSMGAIDLTLDNSMRCFGMKLYGVALFVFASNGLPADWKQRGVWLAEQWRSGNKVLDPMMNGAWLTG